MRRIVAPWLAIALAAGACLATGAQGLAQSPSQSPRSPGPSASPAGSLSAPTDALDGTGWSLTSIGDRSTAPGVVTLAFASGEASGWGGCNDYSGSYALDGSTIAFGPLATTAFSCPEEAAASEAGYLAALAAATSWAIPQDAPMGIQLTLMGPQGNPPLVFGPGSTGPGASPSPPAGSAAPSETTPVTTLPPGQDPITTFLESRYRDLPAEAITRSIARHFRAEREIASLRWPSGDTYWQVARRSWMVCQRAAATPGTPAWDKKEGCRAAVGVLYRSYAIDLDRGFAEDLSAVLGYAKGRLSPPYFEALVRDLESDLG